MSQKAILSDNRFKELVSIAKGNVVAPSSRHLPVSMEEVISIDTVKEILEKEGPAGLPYDAFKRINLDDLSELSEELQFDIADITSSNYGDNTAPINAAFVPSPLIQAGLPIQKPKSNNQTQYHSINGAVEVTLSVPIEKNSKNPATIPWGIPGRVTLAWISTEIITTGRTRIHVDGVKKNFVSDAIMVKPVKGPRGSIARYTESLICWAKTTIQISRNEKYSIISDETADALNLERYEAIPVADEAVLWSSTEFDRSTGGYIQFSNQFVEFVNERAVPIDHETLLFVSTLESPVAYDLFYWAVYRSDRLERSGQPFARLTWDQFRAQFMPNHSFNSRVITEVMRARELLEQNGITLPIALDKKRGVLLRRSASPIKGSISRKSMPTPSQSKLDLD